MKMNQFGHTSEQLSVACDFFMQSVMGGYVWSVPRAYPIQICAAFAMVVILSRLIRINMRKPGR